MRKAVFVAVLVALVIMLLAGTAVASQPRDFWMPGDKLTVTATPVAEGQYTLTVAWPAPTVLVEFDGYVVNLFQNTIVWSISPTATSFGPGQWWASGVRGKITVSPWVWVDSQYVYLDELKAQYKVP